MDNNNFQAVAETPETGKTSAATSLLTAVAQRLHDSAPQVYARFCDALVEKEIAERINLLEASFAALKTANESLHKIARPDNEAFDADGKLVAGTYSKQRLNEIKQANEKIAKINKAIEDALSNNNFGKLREQFGKGNKEKPVEN